MIGSVVELNISEQAISKGIARKRYEHSRQMGVQNQKIGPQSNELTDLEGFAAEVAFCKLFNLMPDFSIEVKSSKLGLDPGDAKLHSGHTVDVKSTVYPYGKLLVTPSKSVKPPDLYALMTGKFPIYTFRGFMSSTDMFLQKRKQKFGAREAYVAYQHELKGSV